MTLWPNRWGSLLFTYLIAFAICATSVSSVRAGLLYQTDKHKQQLELYEASPNNLDAIGTSFTILNHPAFPGYSVRLKKSNFCDGTVRAFTGYIDIEVRHLFFYFFESRNNPGADDVIFWTNGGPGCSSSLGLFMELGELQLVLWPCRVNSPDIITWNPFSWNERANIFFIDQPIGTGFSYAEHGEYVSTTEEAAKDIAAFVAIFFEHFHKLKGRPFHMAGESYGGRMVPVFASEVYDQNAKLIEIGMSPINLQSIMIGNGCTDWVRMLPSYYDMQCTPKSVPPVLEISTCVSQKLALSRCTRWLKKSCYDTVDRINCNAAFNFCAETIVMPFANAGPFSPHDLTKTCEGPRNGSNCYPVTEEIAAYLNQQDVRELIGVDPAVVKFEECNVGIIERFADKMDRMFPTQHYIAALLERGVRALIYVGANDWVCNWVGNERMTLAMEWSGQQEFAGQSLKEWTFEDGVAGLTRSAGPLTFVTIYGAGHMSPYDRPKELLEMLTRWLAHKEF